MDFLTAELNFIREGQTWAIVGTSDSGHSNLLNRINGKGVELVSFRHQFKNLSNTSDFYYQQRFNSSDSEDALTVHEYLIERQVIAENSYWNYGRVVRELHLENLLREQLIKLSNGETKRLLIAAALIRNPKLLLLDHPLTGLDVQTRSSFSNLLDHIIDSGITVIIASNASDIPSAVTHVAEMKEGKIVFADKISNFRKVQAEVRSTSLPDTALLKTLVEDHNRPIFETIVKMTDVNIGYDGRKILSHITWHVRQGERWSLTGPNGAGKSTLLSLISADNPQAYANNITLFDRKRGTGESIWDIKRQIGFVSPELYQFFPGESSCLHVVESGFFDTIGLFRPSDEKKEEICRQWMRLMMIEQYSNLLFSRIPAYAQRLCLLARALVKNPALLILDEPTQGLDDDQQRFFTLLVDELCTLTNVTLIYVSHYDHHIPRSVSRHLRLLNGRVVP